MPINRPVPFFFGGDPSSSSSRRRDRAGRSSSSSSRGRRRAGRSSSSRSSSLRGMAPSFGLRSIVRGHEFAAGVADQPPPRGLGQVLADGSGRGVAHQHEDLVAAAAGPEKWERLAGAKVVVVRLGPLDRLPGFDDEDGAAQTVGYVGKRQRPAAAAAQQEYAGHDADHQADVRLLLRRLAPPRPLIVVIVPAAARSVLVVVVPTTGPSRAVILVVLVSAAPAGRAVVVVVVGARH